MPQVEVSNASLLRMLEQLKPGGNSTQEDLNYAVRDVRAAADIGQSLKHFHRVLRADAEYPAVGTSLDLLQRSAVVGAFSASAERPPQQERTLVSIRSVPARGADPFAPAWSAGLRPTRSAGPFLDKAGQRFWIDTFSLPSGITIEAGTTSGGSSMLMQLPTAGSKEHGVAHVLRRGSAWLPTRLLVPGRSVDEFVGLRISGGTVRITGETLLQGSALKLRGDWSLQLELTLEHAPPVSGESRIGQDAANAAIELPSRVRVRLSSTRAAEIEIEPFRVAAYGSELSLRGSGNAPFFDALSRSLVVPCESARTFTFSSARDATFQVKGTSQVARSGWAAPVTVAPAGALGEADGAGAAWLELKGRLRVRWYGHDPDVTPQTTTLLLAPGALSVFATLLAGDVRQDLQLWNDKRALKPRRCTIGMESTSGSVVLHVSKPGVETFLFGGAARARVDRPLKTDGGALPGSFSSAWLSIASTEEATTATVLGVEETAAAAPHISFAIENALLKTRPPVWLYAFGFLQGDRIDRGLLLLRSPLRALLPTLPDPYAANFDLPRTDVDRGWATAGVAWSEPAVPILGFSLQDAELVAPSQAVATNLAARGVRTGGVGDFVLLDVSSNADQFGIAVPQAAGQARIEGLSVVVPSGEAPVITLPPISWEPMLTKAPASTSGDVALPPPPHDGGVASIVAERDDLRAATPVALLSAHFAAMRDNRHFLARLPLPFGLIANLRTRVELPAAERSRFISRGGSVYMNRPAFPGGLTGARQLGLRAAPRLPESQTPGGFIDPALPGSVEFVDDYAKAVLSTNLHTQFDQEFGPASTGKPGIEPRIPLRHYELSGYGASLFSDWRNTRAPGPAIIQARFDVIAGRTAHEVIQMQSVLYPWFVRVTRSIIIDRTAGGWILREDTGWVAASGGFFAYLPAPADAFPSARRHLGAVTGIERPRNIHLDGPQFPLPVQGGALAIQWQPVRFDADIVFLTGSAPRLAVVQGSALDRVPSREISGWIQIGGPQYTDTANGIPVSLTRPAGASEIFNLLKTAGPARGPIACTLHLGGTEAQPGMVFRASSVDVECNDDASTPELVVAVRGSPTLPRDGAWSLARMVTAEAVPKSLDPSFAIPIVRPNASPAANQWHFGDPADILKLGDADTPANRYGFVQALGAQKLFFDRVRVGNGAKPISVPKAPSLADMGALLHASSIFPGLADAFDLPNLRDLSAQAGDLGFKESFDIAPGREAVLVDLAGDNAIQVVIEYHDENGRPTHVELKVDPQASPRWQLSLARVCFAVRYKKARLISIFAAVLADEHSAPTVKDLCVHYEGVLDALQTIFSNVQQVARFLPGGAGAGLKVGFSQGRLTVHNAFALPTLPLGAGQITDVALEMGFDVTLSPFGFRFMAGLGSSNKPFRWVVSPLAGTGCVQVGVGTSGLDILVQGGLGLGLAIDLGIASGSASIALAMEISTTEDPFMLRGILSGRASVDVLQGLASATITLAAGLGFVPPPELFKPPFLPPQLLPPPSKIPNLTVTLLASVSVGIHISVCWVVDVDWDAYWQFRQQITTPSIPIPV